MEALLTISKPTLGRGVYTLSDVGAILGLSSNKVRRWVVEYWDSKYGLGERNMKYSWNNGYSRAVDFYTLVEIYVFSEMRNAGVKIKDINTAHAELSSLYDTPFPFANKDVIKCLKTDGKTIYFENGKHMFVSLDGTRQFNLPLVQDFFKKLVFDDENNVSRLFPMGKRFNIVVDPHVKMGQPVVKGTAVTAESINEMHEAGESINVIAYLFDIDTKSVRHAIRYCNAAA